MSEDNIVNLISSDEEEPLLGKSKSMESKSTQSKPTQSKLVQTKLMHFKPVPSTSSQSKPGQSKPPDAAKKAKDANPKRRTKNVALLLRTTFGLHRKRLTLNV